MSDIKNVRSFLFEFKDGTELRLVEKENYDKLVERIKELEEENKEIKDTKMNEYLHHNLWLAKYLNELYILKQKVKDKIEEIKEDKESKYFDTFLTVRDINYAIGILEDLLEDK